MFARAGLLAALLGATVAAPAGAAITREQAVAIESEAYEYGCRCSSSCGSGAR